jgi:hypothetical protein
VLDRFLQFWKGKKQVKWLIIACGNGTSLQTPGFGRELEFEEFCPWNRGVHVVKLGLNPKIVLVLFPLDYDKVAKEQNI